MENVRRRRGAKPSALQKEMVAKLMEAHPGLARGRLDGPEAARRAAGLWRAAAKRLNATGGAVKTWKEWRKYWNDKKTVLKGIANKRFQCMIEAGDDASAYIPSLGEWEERMLAVLGDGFGQPTPNTSVSLFSAGSNRVKKVELVTSDTANEEVQSPGDAAQGSKAAASVGSDEEMSNNFDGPDPFEGCDEKWEWYEEENDDEEEQQREETKPNLKRKLSGDLSREGKRYSSRNGRMMALSPEPRIINREVINQSNQSFGVFIANELQQYELLERYEIMKKIIDIFIKK